MRATTHVEIGLRNTGDSQAEIQYFSGPLKDGILWLATQFATITMATRIDLVVARNREEINRGLANSRAGKSKISAEMQTMLDDMMNQIEWVDDESAEGDNGAIDSPKQSAPQIEGDTYES